MIFDAPIVDSRAKRRIVSILFPALVPALVALVLTFVALTTLRQADAAPLEAEIGEAFQGSEFGWLLSEGMIGRFAATGQPGALRLVARLFREGDERAPNALRNYLDRFPRDPAAYDLAGIQLLREGSYRDAVMSFRHALTLAPEAVWIRAKLGAALLLSGRMEEGERELLTVIESAPDNALARRYLAWLAVSQDNLPAAIIHSERSLAAFGLPEGRINQAHFDLAELYSRAGRHAEVMTLLGGAVHNTELEVSQRIAGELFGRYFDAALSSRNAYAARLAFDRLAAMLDPSHPEIGVSHSRLMLLEGDADGAVEAIEAVRNAHPEMAADLTPDLAQAEAAAGRIDSAVNRLAALANIRGPGHDLPLIREAVAMLISAERTEDAVALLDSGIADRPERADLRHLKAELFVQSGDLERARAEAELLMHELPDLALGHYLLGTIASTQGDRDIAVRHLRRSVELEPTNPGAWLTLVGAVHGHETYAHGEGDDASHAEVEALLVEAIEANPESPQLHTELGLLHLTEGRLDEAIAALDAATTNAPGYLPALTLGALARADAEHDLDRAAQLIRGARTIAPDDPIAMDVDGWVRTRTGAMEEGLELLRRAIAVTPEDETTLYHLGVVMYETGQPDLARNYLLTALAGDLYLHNAETARDILRRLDPAEFLTVPVHRIGKQGIGEELGTILLEETGAGVRFTADLSNLPPGPNAAHVHERPSCEPVTTGGETVVAGKAGAHYGHHDHHAMPASADHSTHTMTLPKGDLPALMFDAQGRSSGQVLGDRLTLDEIRGRSLIIHQGPDRNGVSGPKIACAVIP